MTRAWKLGSLAVLLAAFCLARPGVAAATTRYVSAVDPSCGGHAPCYATIQAAINAAQAGDTVRILAGTYAEQLLIHGKNNVASATEASRIVIEADPSAPVGSVVLTGPNALCASGDAIRVQQSKFVTLRGLTITGAGGQAIAILGGSNQNRAIHVERNRLFGNNPAGDCEGALTINRGNPDTLIANNLIYGNGRNGVGFVNPDGGPHYVVGNTIHGNGATGVRVAGDHQVVLVNNAITQNGLTPGTTGGRFGVSREGTGSPSPPHTHLLNNLICGNLGGELNGPLLDATDSGNLTPTGTEGAGVAPSPGCELPATVYRSLAGPDNVAGTFDDDFTLAAGSPALDRGIDPRTLGLAPSFNSLFEADYAAAAARPQPALQGGTPAFDIGAVELPPQAPDHDAPTITILQPAASAYVRGTITLQARATDTGSGVDTIAFQVDAQTVATLTNPDPTQPFTATTTFNTTTVADGTHTLRATATDRAGNSDSVAQTMIVDNTPPDTQITAGPTGEIATSAATVTFTGTDNLTAAVNLVFAWRFDGAPFSAFTSATTATLTGLTEGAHTFEVTARDLAGNEDPTPATRSFTVRFGPAITTVDPVSGPVGTLVTITGQRFEPGSTPVTFNGVAAVIRTITATTITTTVPLAATTGLLAVTTSRGTASQLFTVSTTGDFTLTAAPALPATARVIAGDQTSVSVAAGGSGSFTGLVSLSVSGGATGVTTTLAPALLAPGGSSFVTVAVPTTVAAGVYGFTVTGQAQVDGQTLTRTASFSLEVLAPTTPAVTGRVLTAEALPRPIVGAMITLGGAFTLTDAAGNFVLLAPPAGANMLLVDGRTGSTPSAQYPVVEVNISVNSSGPTRVPFVIYLPKLDTAHPVTLPIDASGAVTQTVQATTPLIPGLVVTIPAGTRIIGPEGNPVSQITMTAVPIDRSPMPFPPGVVAPMLFSLQPGGATPSQPLPITFPNVQQALPGTVADLYYFDLVTGGWHVWGTGTVSADGTRIVSNPGYGLPRFAWHFAATAVALIDEVRSRHAHGGEPVDLVTGRFIVSKTDLVLPARIPIRIQRHYRSENPQPGLLGIGWNLDLYDSRLIATGTSLSLILPDQSSYLLAPSGAGQWTNTTEPFLRGAVLTALAGEFNFQLRFKDGTVQRFDRIIGFSNLAGLAAITDPNGNTVTIERAPVPPFGRITRIVEPAGRVFTFSYDGAGRITTVTDPIGRIVAYTYDAQGRLATATDPAGGVTGYTYDASHRILTITDPRGITYLTNEYDPVTGRVTRQTQADGGVWTFVYTLTGGVVTETTVTNPRGNPTRHRFSSQGFTLSMTDALGQTTVNEYAEGSNLLLATTDPLGRTTRFSYDPAGNVLTLTDPAGNVRTFTYEPTFSRVTSSTDPLGHVTQFEYDTHGNLTAAVDPLGNRATIAYDATGQPLAITDPVAHTSTATYDAFGNLATAADPLGNTMTRQSDDVGRVTRQVDPRGKVTVVGYDALNRVRNFTDALGGVTSFGYDGNGNLLTVTDARGGTTTYTYDGMDRLLTRIDPVGAAESFAYDGNGNLTGHTDRKGQVTTLGYDALERRTGATYADGTSTTLRYDAIGRLLEAIDSVGSGIERRYDVLGRLLSETTALGTVAYQYDALGRRTRLDTPGQSAITYGYDAASRLRQILQGTQTVDLQYDTVGRRTRLTLPNAVSTEYQYDAASRLTALIYRNTVGQLGDLTYEYDAAGNRVSVGGSFARTLLPAAISSATYNAANRQLTFGNTTLAYDPNGNLGSLTEPSGSTALTWDARDRLVGLAGPANVASFVYDPRGRRMTKTVNGTTTAYLHDGVDVVQEASGGTTVVSLRTLNVDELLSRAGTETHLGDALGSTVALADADGTLQTEYTYEPFGATTTTGAATSNVVAYTGREAEISGLYYYRARYYHPGLQRFVSEDPIGFGGGLHLYGYVANDPVNARDPLGTRPSSGRDGSVMMGFIWAGSRIAISGTTLATGVAAAGLAVLLAPSPTQSDIDDRPYERIAFGQKRISPTFWDGVTLYGRAASIMLGEQPSLDVTRFEGQLAAINNRTLAAYGLAHARPSNIVMRPFETLPTEVRARFYEPGVPTFTIPVTVGDAILFHVDAPR